jgi:hypothetical protein
MILRWFGIPSYPNFFQHFAENIGGDVLHVRPVSYQINRCENLGICSAAGILDNPIVE